MFSFNRIQSWLRVPGWLLVYCVILTATATTSLAQSSEAPQAKPAAPEWITSIIGSGANEEIIKEYSPKLQGWNQTIEELEGKATSPWIPQDQFQNANETLGKIRVKLKEFIEQLTPKLVAAREQLKQLGPAPENDQQEAADIGLQRKTLSEEVAAYDSLIKRAQVLDVQVGQVLTTFGSTRRKQFVRQILRQSNEIRDGWYWQYISRAVQIQTFKAFTIASDWLRQKIAPLWPAYVLIAGIAIAIGYFSDRLLQSLLRSSPATISYPVQTRAERGAITLRRTVATAGPVALAFAAVDLMLLSFGLLTSEENRFLSECFIYITVTTFLISAAYFALRPLHDSERLIAIDEKSATQIFWILSGLIAVWFGDQFFSLLDQHLSSPLELSILRSAVIAFIVGTLLICLLFIRVKRNDANPETVKTRGWPRWLFGAIATTAFVILAAVGLGYISLARFIGTQIVATGGLLAFVTLIHLTAEFISSPRPTLGAEDKDEVDHTVIGATLGVALGLTLDLLMLLIGIPLLFLQWGYEWAEIHVWLSSALFGFQIGDINVSLISVFVGIAILVGGVLLTRLVRGMFVRRSAHVFKSSTGARDSIATVLTYAGFVLSIIAAISYLGFSVSNIALIAGALSVGIGFGLQSVANNFVSGLILLAERPIKVGDWIVVGNREGRVQRISVRSTQIRTFDRSTVIVPNADLITGQVVNWDHGDTSGRVVINVGVAYGSDPRKVIALLTQIGNDHPLTVQNDASPFVVFEEFGDSSLNFSLRVVIRNVSNLLKTQTDLRIAIIEAFEREGIEIPFPQRDVHIKQDYKIAAVAHTENKSADAQSAS